MLELDGASALENKILTIFLTLKKSFYAENPSMQKNYVTEKHTKKLDFPPKLFVDLTITNLGSAFF